MQNPFIPEDEFVDSRKIGQFVLRGQKPAETVSDQFFRIHVQSLQNQDTKRGEILTSPKALLAKLIFPVFIDTMKIGTRGRSKIAGPTCQKDPLQSFMYLLERFSNNENIQERGP